MKINSGIYKNRILTGYHDPLIRPTKSLVKEAVIAMLQDDIPEAVVLDLFAGTGSVGLEMLSWGAKHVYLNDLNSSSTLAENAKGFSNVTVSSLDALALLKKMSKSEQCCDIIFIDPPYSYPYYQKIMRYIHDLTLLTNNGYIVIESDMTNPADETYFKIIKQKKYGKSFITIYQNKIAKEPA